MAALSETEFAEKWLDNFEVVDRPTAKLLLDNLFLVSASDFQMGLNELLERLLKDNQENLPVSLYAEREPPRGPFFEGSAQGRAKGPGPAALPYGTKDKMVGSEGPIANLIKGFCNKHASTVFSHSGPDQLRSKKVRRVVLVTDLIGSGKRIFELLDSFSSVATLRSWRSYGLIKFSVVAYCYTVAGRAKVESHPWCDDILVRHAVPTLNNCFRGAERASMISLCKRYDPAKHSRLPLGFLDTGALIAFSHGVPNNAPSILHWQSDDWNALFPRRSASGSVVDQFRTPEDEVRRRCVDMLKVETLRSELRLFHGSRGRQVALVLAALRSGRRSESDVSALTRMPVEVTREILSLLIDVGWATEKCSLTELGRRELRRVSRFQYVHGRIEFPVDEYYFPNQLRAR
ncbi:MAG: hypothetical protein CMK07_05165 [Ponticaulis sp.]|nr:hypothetical protein [Ponticaulis sp.]